LVVPYIPEKFKSVWAQYTVRARDDAHRRMLQSRLKEAKIPTAIYYPKPLHLQDAFVGLGYEAGDLPVSEDYASRVFSLPMHPYLKLEDLQSIACHLTDSDE
jgi:UDP-2-acetamido-2-deoxy-ribo-hexuluronate aminotransferase